MKKYLSQILICTVGVILLGGVSYLGAASFGQSAQIQVETMNVEAISFQVGEGDASDAVTGEFIGGMTGTTHFTYDVSVGEDLVVGDDVAITDDLVVSGATTLTGEVTLKEATTVIAATSIYSTTTLTIADSGTTYYLSASGTTITLPAITDGINFRFVINGASTDGNFIIDSAEGDNIEGTLIVAGAVVDCAAEDQINFVVDGENLGDYVEVRSDGTQWLIGDSGALTAAKLTCTDP